MHLDPNKMSPSHCARIARWFEVNGCRHWIALEPIVIRGGVAEYVALAIKDNDKSIDRQIRGMEMVPLGQKRLRLRIPLSKVA